DGRSGSDPVPYPLKPSPSPGPPSCLFRVQSCLLRVQSSLFLVRSSLFRRAWPSRSRYTLLLQMPRPAVFVSYSHQDERWKDRLVQQLRVLEPEGDFEVWDDRRIAAGSDWLPEIEQAMHRAVAAVLLISADFLTSKFILSQEVPRLLERRQAK